MRDVVGDRVADVLDRLGRRAGRRCRPRGRAGSRSSGARSRARGRPRRRRPAAASSSCPCRRRRLSTRPHPTARGSLGVSVSSSRSTSRSKARRGQQLRERRLDLRLAADRVAGLRLVGGERVLDRLGDRLGGQAPGGRLRRQRLDAVELGRRRARPSPGPSDSRSAGAASIPLSQISVAIEPGSTTETSTPNWRISWRSESPTALERCLRGVVGREVGEPAAAADRGDEDDPAARGADHRQERLGDRDLADDVDLELAPVLVQRHRLDRPGDGDAGVVDQPGEPAAGRLARPARRRRRSRRRR